MFKKYEERIKELLIEGAIPETDAEELLVFFYDGAKEGHGLQDLALEVQDLFDAASLYELEMVLIGYMLGQNVRNEEQNLTNTNLH